VVALGIGQGGLILWLILGSPLHLPVPGSKELGWVQQHFDVRPEYTRWNPVGRVDVLPTIQVKEPMIVGGISRVYLASDAFQQAPLYDLKLVTLDGTSMTGMYRFDGTDQDLQRFRFLDHAIISAPYHLGLKHDTTLKIGVGGGLDILLARLYGAKQITAIELNADVVKLLEGPYREFSGNLAGHPSTRIIVARRCDSAASPILRRTLQLSPTTPIPRRRCWFRHLRFRRRQLSDCGHGRAPMGLSCCTIHWNVSTPLMQHTCTRPIRALLKQRISSTSFR